MPHIALYFICWNSDRLCIDHSCIVSSRRVALFNKVSGTNEEQLEICFHPFAAYIHHTQVLLGLRATVIGCFLQPVACVGTVLGHSLSGVIKA
jgi:hypothetical protein